MASDSSRILLVEEDRLLAEVTAFRLELLGFQVDVVGSGEMALGSVLRQTPDVIVVDLVLPDMTGIEVTNRLANAPRTSAIPILALSTNADLNEVQRAYAAGAKDYVVVPYDPAVLEHKLERLLQTVGKAV